MAKTGGHWRGFLSAVVFACCTAGAGMWALGWLDRDVAVVGRDVLSGLRSYLRVEQSAPVANAPSRPDLFPSRGERPASTRAPLDMPGSTGSAVTRDLAIHADRGAVVGYPKILDGDMLVLNGQTVVLWGIDAPERGQICRRRGAGWRCGEDAEAALVGFVAGRQVACYKKGVDHQDRMLGQCYLGQLDINGWMVRNGWAFAERTVTREYASRESMARMRKTGVWTASYVDRPWDWRRGRIRRD